MKRFYLVRREDVSGTSGVGTVAEGVEFDDGTGAVLHWLTKLSSTAVYRSMADLVAIHGHDGRTQVVWMDYEGSESPEPIAESLT